MCQQKTPQRIVVFFLLHCFLTSILLPGFAWGEKDSLFCLRPPSTLKEKTALQQAIKDGGDHTLRGKFLQEGLFSQPVMVKGDTGQTISLKMRFADSSWETARQVAGVLLAGEESLLQYGKLSRAEAEMLRRHRSHFDYYIRNIQADLTRNPWSVVAEDDTGHIRGVVFSALGWARAAEDLPDTAVKMVRWHEQHLSQKRNTMVDFWFTGGGNGAIAGAMIDASMEVAKAITAARVPNLRVGHQRIFAFSTPRTLHRYPDLSPEEYAKKVKKKELKDPAISLHFKKGARLARMIPHGYPNIEDSPGIGRGYVFVMQYPFPSNKDSVASADGGERVRRLNLDQARKVLEEDLVELHHKVDDLSSLLFGTAQTIQKTRKLPPSTHWFPALQQEEKEMEALARRVDSVQTFVGFEEEKLREPLDAFLTRWARKHQADKALLWIESHAHYFTYSRGFTQEELEHLTEHRDEILRLHHPTMHDPHALQGAKELLSQLGVASLVRSHPLTKGWRPKEPLTLNLVLGRTQETVERVGAFEHQDILFIEKTLKQSLKEGTDVWRSIDQQFRKEDYKTFGSLMRTIRHNSVTHWWKRNHVSVLRGFINEFKEVMDGKPMAPDLADRLVDEAKNIEETVSRGDVYVQLLEEGEKFEKADVVPVIKEAVESAILENQKGIREKGLQVEVQLDESAGLFAVIDRKLLKIVVENLVENAVKFNKKDGHMTLRLSHSDFMETQNLNGTIERYRRDSIRFEVSDTGIGVPKDEFIAIFGYRQRGSNVGDRSGGGEGLHIAHRYTHILQGEIFLQSKLEEGSTFTLFLPEVKESGTVEEELAQDGGKRKEIHATPLPYREHVAQSLLQGSI